MFFQPDGVELIQTGHSGNWVKERVGLWTSEDGTQVRSLIPVGFEAYARVFHPAECQTADGNWKRVSWSTVASWNEKVVHPQMSCPRIAKLDPWLKDTPIGFQAPFFGRLPEEECRVLVSVLKGFTSTSELCYYCLWHGYGFLNERHFKRVPKLKLPGGREYLLFRGPLGSIMSFYFYKDVEGRWSGWGQPPNIWWPEDRAWCVATDIDSLDTLVGGSESCIEQILAHPGLEALPIAVDARIDHLGDTVNG